MESRSQQTSSEETPSLDSHSKELAYQAPFVNGGVRPDRVVDRSYAMNFYPSHPLEAHMALVGRELKPYIRTTINISDGLGLTYLADGVDDQLLSLIRADQGVKSVDYISFGEMDGSFRLESSVYFDDLLLEE